MNNISFNPFPILQTKRLTLRRLKSKDAPEVYFLRTDPLVNKYIKRPITKDITAAQNFITKINTGIDNNENIYWPITLSGEDQMLGAISLWHFSEDKKIAEVGYDLHPTIQGKGYMSEALSCVLDYGFEKLKLDMITAYTHHENINSIKLLKKNGFRLMKGEVDECNENNIIFSKTNKRIS